MKSNALTTSLTAAFLVTASAHAAVTNLITDGSFESQAVLQNNPYYQQADGARWGAAWSNWGWSSWQSNTVGAWTGGAIARTEEFAAGWKHARTGDVFGIVQTRGTLSQSVTATESGLYNLSWFDANRASWRNVEWFGQENDYSVTVTDALGNVQTVGNYTSVVAGGNSYSSTPGNGWWTTEGKTGWFAKTGTNVNLVAGMTYTVSFNSLSPYIFDGSGNITGVEDRTTFVDDISLSLVPTPGAAALVGLAGLMTRRRKA